ncbi:Glandicoline B O-methyltransferase roqN [Lachnellula suecica]|uniref:Glandicoline B O-methyltransferase roqN n=1 Tax=Lachnellula suecica TaxID=602035 RepID=A0A8T9BW39_9HELO|nr:Glandicoline B O-methyltransferase roqN [Lachnellula suecica]
MAESFHSLHANVYDRMASGATISIGAIAIDTLPLPITPSSYILDNSCGTGLVSAYIKERFPFAKIKGTDIAPGSIGIFNKRVQEGKWEGVDAEVLDCRELKTLGDGTFSHVVTNFGFAPQPDDDTGRVRAAAEMWRVLRPGGVAVVTTWAKRNFDDAFEAACRRIRPDEKPYSWKSTSGWDKGWWLMQHLEEAGFGHQVEVRSVKGKLSAGSLEELVGNWMLLKGMFFKHYKEDELKRLPAVLAEEARKLPAFKETKEGVEIETVAWIGVGTK